MLASVNAGFGRRTAATFCLALAGGALFTLFDFPASWLSGAMLFVAIASLGGLESEVPKGLRGIFYLFLGIFAGSGANPRTLEQIALWPISFAMLLVTVVGVTAAGYVMLHKLFSWDRQSSLFASLPGAMSFVLAAAEKVELDIRKVAVAQSLRLLILVEIVPLAVLLTRHQAEPAIDSVQLMSLPDMALLVVCGIIGGVFGEKTRIPGGLLLGGLAVSAGLFVTGTVSGQFPSWLIVCGMIGLGANVGSRFRPADRPLLPRIARASVTAFCAALLVSAAMALLTSHLLGIEFVQIFLAFAPGGLDALTILAFAMQIDPAYVAAHQVVRFFLLALIVPALVRRIIKSEQRFNG